MILHLTTHERGRSICVEIPLDHHPQFPAGKRVKLEDDPNISVRTFVWGAGRRFATIRRRSQHADRFGARVDVQVEAV
ncbi:MAG: hypothetical protein GWP10_21160 [Nitrospiraceae bacterium]|nr:hypothetical protein [Nitrospiraceae bacterium]